jgi:hypothetical protein
VAAVIVNVHVPVPSHGPAPQPVNVDPFVPAAVNVIAVPLAKFAEHVGWQVIPAGLLITVPVPFPPSVMVRLSPEPVPVSVTVCGLPVALSAMFNVAVRVPLAVGVNSTLIVQLAPAARVPCSGLHIAGEFGRGTPKSAEFVPVIVKPEKLTVPVPVFVTVTISAGLVVPTVCELNVKLVGDTVTVAPVDVSNVAVTVTLAVAIGTVHVGGFVCGLAGVQLLLKPANVEPAAAVAVKVTCVPIGKFAIQVIGQLIAPEPSVTVPLPLPTGVTVSVSALAGVT